VSPLGLILKLDRAHKLFRVMANRSPELEEPTLSEVLDSLIPFVRGNKNISKLPVYKGKSVVGEGQVSEGTSTGLNSVEGKEFA